MSRCCRRPFVIELPLTALHLTECESFTTAEGAVVSLGREKVNADANWRSSGDDSSVS
jgi:hypothetical protein